MNRYAAVFSVLALAAAPALACEYSKDDSSATAPAASTQSVAASQLPAAPTAPKALRTPTGKEPVATTPTGKAKVASTSDQVVVSRAIKGS